MGLYNLWQEAEVSTMTDLHQFVEMVVALVALSCSPMLRMSFS
jgi:hypothetical protein